MLKAMGDTAKAVSELNSLLTVYVIRCILLIVRHVTVILPTGS